MTEPSSLDIIAAKQVGRLVGAVTWVSDRLGLSEPTIVDAEYLRQLPEETFGRVWIDTMDTAGLTPFTSGPRRQQLHDGIHVLTGYQTDPLGEAEVQAFLMGAKFRVFHGVVLSQMILAVALFRPVAMRVAQGYEGFNGVSSLIKYVVAAYKRGQQADLDPDRWQPESVWEWSLEEVQALYKVVPTSRRLQPQG